MINPIETVPGVVERLRAGYEFTINEENREVVDKEATNALLTEAADLIEQLAARLDAEKAPVGGGEPLPVDHIAQLIRIHAGTMGAGRLAEMILATLSPAPIPEAAASLAVGEAGA